ncbi:MAG: dCTP deaminase [Phycisphaerales bacterium]
MGVLSGKEIRKRLSRPINDSQSIVITPLLDDDFGNDAIDLRLGCYFRLPATTSIECIRPYNNFNNINQHYPELIHKPYGRKEDEALILQPHHAVLASTLEYIKIPKDVSGQILTKSSWARIFINIASAPWVHPFYRGCLTLEITNTGNVPVALSVGKPIAQLIFIKIEGELENGDDIIEGSYAGAVKPESPMFNH